MQEGKKRRSEVRERVRRVVDVECLAQESLAARRCPPVNGQ